MPNARTFRIMVVDDLRSMRQLIRSSLLELGCHNLAECVDGEQALYEFSLHPPQLIISDLNMPKLDGLGLLRAIRNTPGREGTPFIMLTTRGEVSTVIEARELKVNNYLVKPFTLSTLKSKIESVVGPLT